MQELSLYTEYLDRNSSHDLQSTEEEMLWKLAREKMPYQNSKIHFYRFACCVCQVCGIGRTKMVFMQFIQRQKPFVRFLSQKPLLFLVEHLVSCFQQVIITYLCGRSKIRNQKDQLFTEDLRW